MDGVEEEGRESQGKRNLERERAKRGQPWRRRAIARARLLPHQRLRAIAPALLFLKAAAISPARTTTASAFFHSLSSSSSFFPSTSLPPLQAFFHQFPDCRRAKLGYYRRCYLPSCPSLSPPISSSVFLLLVRFPFCTSFSIFLFFFLVLFFSPLVSFASLRCLERREGRLGARTPVCLAFACSSQNSDFLVN